MKITQSGLTISPAYGRDYKSAAEAQLDFNKGKDFIMQSNRCGGTYCSMQDFAPGVEVRIRYQKMRKVITVKVPGDEA